MHHASVSTNYPWLPHNVQPENYPTPPEYEGMPIQPLGNREAFYRDMILGCIIHYGVEGGKKCIGNEEYRIEMSLRQPQSMVNYTELVRQWALSIWLAFFFLLCGSVDDSYNRSNLIRSDPCSALLFFFVML